MKRIECSGTKTIDTTPKDGIICGCYQCPHAINKADAPWDTPNIWICDHPDNKGASDVIQSGKGFIKGCPIKAEMFKRKPSLKRLYRVPRKTPFEKWMETDEANVYSSLYVALVPETKRVIAAHKNLESLKEIVEPKRSENPSIVYGKVPYSFIRSTA